MLASFGDGMLTRRGGVLFETDVFMFFCETCRTIYLFRLCGWLKSRIGQVNPWALTIGLDFLVIPGEGHSRHMRRVVPWHWARTSIKTVPLSPNIYIYIYKCVYRRGRT